MGKIKVNYLLLENVVGALLMRISSITRLSIEGEYVLKDGIIIGSIIWLIIRALIIFRNEKYKSLSIKREIIFNTFVVYCIAVVSVILPDFSMIGRGMTSIHPSINIVPFVDIINGFQHSPFSFAFKTKLLLRNLLGNLVLLLPLAVFLPMLWTKFRYIKKTILVGVTVSLTIELIQLLFSFLGLSGRITDIDDLILNSIGVLIGYFIYSKIFVRLNLFSQFVTIG